MFISLETGTVSSLTFCQLLDVTVTSCVTQYKPALKYISKSAWTLTQTHGCLSAWSAVILFAGLMVSIWLMRFLASGVTVSHSGEGN